MSQYLHLFIRGKDNSFYPIGTFSRSSEIYTAFHEATYPPYEKITALTSSRLKEAEDFFEARIKITENSIKEVDELISYTYNCNNSLEDKMEYIYKHLDSKREYENQLEELKVGLSYMYNLVLMLGEAEDTKYYEDKSLMLDSNKYIYYGIECAHPTVNDITGED